ncbi:nitroreductase [Phenylobacterium sp.]|uniref:nitroreductase family protein n=1 Tax=Phenylobacterium sp. TaxID=1871053 RepID=UPI002BD7C5B2|nr:nitroreductase [Phenylobacterium sp.]HVI33838.1 nitroreductase [Phenylobacterium sp.]
MTARLPPAPEFGAPLPLRATPEVLDFLALRRSTSAVTLGEPAPPADAVQDLLRIAARAPDHGKLSPWRFIILDGATKARFAARLEALAEGRGDATAAAKLAKLRAPPLAVVVVSSPKPGQIPEWEQLLSAGAVCANLLNATLALGYGANWITDWYSYDAEALAILGLRERERVAAFMLVGTPREAPLERERPDPAALTTRWDG